MAPSREVREVLLLAHDENIIIGEENFLLNDLKTGTRAFDRYTMKIRILLFIGMICADLQKFWLYQMKLFACYDIVCTIDGIEAFCMVLKRYAYWYWYSDLIQWCDRSVPELCLILKAIPILILCMQKERHWVTVLGSWMEWFDQCISQPIIREFYFMVINVYML